MIKRANRPNAVLYQPRVQAPFYSTDFSMILSYDHFAGVRLESGGDGSILLFTKSASYC